MKTDKFKYFTIVLYPDDDNYLNILEHITSNYKYKYILHDKDEVKPHYHVVFEVPSPRTLDSIKKELNVSYIENVRTIKKMIEYLTHENAQDKFHYSIENCFGDLELFNSSEKEISDILVIMNFIDSYTGYLTLSTLNSFVLKKGLWSSYRHSSYIMIKTLEEHNKMC